MNNYNKWNKLKTKTTAVLSERIRGSIHRSESGRVRNFATTPPWLAVVFNILFDIYKDLILLLTTFAPVSWRQCPHCPHDILSKFAAPWVLIRLVANEINWKLKITVVLSERVRGSIWIRQSAKSCHYTTLTGCCLGILFDIYQTADLAVHYNLIPIP